VGGLYARRSKADGCWSNPPGPGDNQVLVTPNPTRNRYFRHRIRMVVQWLVCLAIVMVLAMAILPLAFLWLAWHGVKRPLHALGLLLDDMSRD
jgi:hypothetical protein